MNRCVCKVLTQPVRCAAKQPPAATETLATGLTYFRVLVIPPNDCDPSRMTPAQRRTEAAGLLELDLHRLRPRDTDLPSTIELGLHSLGVSTLPEESRQLPKGPRLELANYCDDSFPSLFATKDIHTPSNRSPVILHVTLIALAIDDFVQSSP